MGQRTDLFDLGTLGLSSGEGRRLELEVPVAAVSLGGEQYRPAPDPVGVVLDVARTTGGYALRLRFEANLEGPCMRCLEDSSAHLTVDARDVHEEGGGDPDLRSPYMVGEELDVSSWARDSLLLALPSQVVCRDACRGLCADCGASLNDDPEHAHDRAPDPRWAKLAEIEFE